MRENMINQEELDRKEEENNDDEVDYGDEEQEWSQPQFRRSTRMSVRPAYLSDFVLWNDHMGLLLEPIHQTPQHDIETGQQLPLPKVILFKDIKVEEEGGGGCGKSSCPICLEEYDMMIMRLGD
uniref:Uncharacterized protein n=1 Tax=Brassica oleracea var. oleracea TaxID=109376 RepID=A0A0D3BMP9_BRAOL